MLVTVKHLCALPGEKYGRDTRVIPVDFTDGFEIYARLAEQLDSLDIGVLGNV